ncbi:hypothetical protein VTN49DRAFT_7710 [Thermomyces lanuginosus]|uniref:uncharacterized protein n=1 Tax=Thermomyces lanuginosus TaxID=5541 RepID=UPI003742FBB8
MILVFFAPLFLLVVFLALSSCLGDSLRAYLRGASRNDLGSYRANYFRTMTNPGVALSEQIELEDLMRERHYEHDESDHR